MESVVEPVVAEVLRKVNPVLRGWVAYFRLRRIEEDIHNALGPAPAHSKPEVRETLCA
ncbi:group II intron maturase-specific domain-containing protein [Streptomyces sp. NPDC001275]